MGVEAELEQHFQSMERLFRQNSERVEALAPKLENLHHELEEVQSMVKERLSSDAKVYHYPWIEASC